MEKFSIFELLDALCALTGRDADADGTKDAAQAPPAKTPPPAEAPERDAPGKDAATDAPAQDALSVFLAHHDAVSRRAGRKK